MISIIKINQKYNSFQSEKEQNNFISHLIKLENRKKQNINSTKKSKYPTYFLEQNGLLIRICQTTFRAVFFIK